MPPVCLAGWGFRFSRSTIAPTLIYPSRAIAPNSSWDNRSNQPYKTAIAWETINTLMPKKDKMGKVVTTITVTVMSNPKSKIANPKLTLFRVVTPGFSQEFERWTDALNTAKALIPQCKSWLEDIRIYAGEDLIWVYSKSHKFPQYIGAGTYDRLARLFILEVMEEESMKNGDNREKPAS